MLTLLAAFVRQQISLFDTNASPKNLSKLAYLFKNSRVRKPEWVISIRLAALVSSGILSWTETKFSRDNVLSIFIPEVTAVEDLSGARAAQQKLAAAAARDLPFLLFVHTNFKSLLP